MRVSLIKNNIIKDLILPRKVSGSYWITDYDENGNEENLVNIEATEEGWKVVSNEDVFCILNDKKISSVLLKEYSFYPIKNKTDNSFMLIYCSPINDQTYKFYEINSIVNGITIGNDSRCDISYNSELISEIHARISLVSLENDKDANLNKLIIKEYDPKNNVKATKWGVYANNKKIKGTQILENNDVIFIMGLKIIVSKLDNKYICAINNPSERVNLNINNFRPITNIMTDTQYFEENEEIEMNLYDENDYFHKKPRFINKIETLDLSIDPPPTKETDPGTSVILTIGPMLTMSMTSLVMGYTAISNVLNENSTWRQATPSIVICVAMFCSIFIWPFITKAYEKRRRKKNEKERQIKYTKYIEEKRKIIQNEVIRQKNILLESFPSTSECQEIILKKTNRLWERRIGDDDFLKVNLGIGNQEMRINIKYPEEHFSMIEDNLKSIVTNLGTEPKILTNVPIELSLLEYNILAIIGKRTNNFNLTSQLLLQLTALHSYDDLKIIMLTNKERESEWKFLRVLPHLFSDDKSIRYFGTTNEEHKEICYHLERIYISRKDAETNISKKNNYEPHYLIITDSFRSIRSFEIIKKLLEEKNNIGFSLIILNDKVSTLPDRCQTFINTSEEKGDLFKSLLNNKTQSFIIDNKNFYDYNLCYKTLANIPIEIDKNKSGVLPDKIGFLEMYDVGKIEQLNINNRWKDNNPELSLGVPVGFGKDGEKIALDLHEKYHGPHGLIAGMTGSGKSEFIITYILSMAVNYHPYEVQFILIDYKGGGLAGAFENKALNIKLPHLVGTITNLDTNEIKRSFASIESELKRRQKAFNKAREISGESTVDIYKYQRMYRDKIVEESVSHLFIICDEFAELKNSQPEFMEQLISTARIGRSLGVHLILATQKPSGVVDPQIWSNTRFRVCLRVQEKSDSSEVIKCPDAAFLKQTGRFYFQVGFNEIFELGQAAWAGGKYIPSEKIKKSSDTSINFVNNLGYVIKSVESKKKQEIKSSNAEELSSIVKWLSDIADEENINCIPLWLDKIPALILVNDLIEKYHYQKDNYMINPIIGEYDDPNMQEQHLLTLPLTKEGNALIYGVAGSGKETLLTTVLYSSLIYYSPKEVNYYILDFGSESLRMFKDAKIVGDILLSTDEEKIENLYKMINKELEKRKKLFADYGGDYQNYCKNNDNTIPAIIVIINNYEAYQEMQSDHDEDLIIITRDCVKYGIYFIITVNTPNGVRFKLKQNFNQEFVLGQNNEDDYTTILGNVQKTYPSKLLGRGIIKTDQVYEFQTAKVVDKEDVRKFIKEKCVEISEQFNEKAEPIKVLPEVVSLKDIENDLGEYNKLIIGLSRQDLTSVTYDYRKNCGNLITSLDITLIYPLIKSIIGQLIYLKNSVIFINADDYVLDDKYKEYINYEDSNFDDIFEKLFDYIRKKENEFIDSNYDKNLFANMNNVIVLINGIDSFRNKLNDNNRVNLKIMFEKAKELGIIKFIFIDSVDNIRKVETEQWYKMLVNSNNGVWIGNGINDQFSLKITQRTKEIKEEIPDNFGFVVKRGKPVLTKIIEEFD